MPKTIAIIGAGEAGLRLGIGLLQKGIATALFTNRTAEQIFNGPILSTQLVFDQALQIDRKLGLNFWDKTCPQNTAMKTVIGQSGTHKIELQWQGVTKHYYQAVDQRVKFSAWMEQFEKLGGKLHIEAVGLSRLDAIAAQYDLTIVASGNSEISQAFVRNNSRSLFNTPQRALACLYVRGLDIGDNPLGIRGNVIPEVGEYFVMPGLTRYNQACRMLLLEGIPGGAFDGWETIKQPQQRLAKAIQLIQQFIPWEFEHAKNFVLTDDNATLAGRYTPVVKHPILHLPCGKSALGIGDTVVLNDPIAAQGANSAAKAADVYLKRILEHENKVFDEVWMQDTFEAYWNQYGRWATEWTNILLTPKPHIMTLTEAAASIPQLANLLANAFDDPATLFPWISDPAETMAFIKNID